MTPALTAASVVVASVGVVSVIASLPWQTTYAAVSPHLVVADALAALSLMVAGALLWSDRPADSRSALLVLATGAWACGDWVGWQGGPDVVRTLGVVGQATLLPLVAHLCARTWRTWLSLQRAVPWLYAVTLGLVVARLIVANPMADPNCWQNCSANTLFVTDQPAVAAALGRASLVLSTTIGAVMAVAGCWLALGGPVARRLHLAVILPAAVFGLAAAAQGVLVLSGVAETPVDRRFVVLHAASAWALVALGVGFISVVVRARRARRLAGELARQLAESSDRSVEGLLGGAIGDPTVQVAYRVQNPEGWVDGTGRRVGAPDGVPGRGVVHVTHADQLIAVVSHDSFVADDVDIATALGPAARLAIENESLRAQQLARLHELRDSQRRIVEAADVERTRLERNLHDAAQVSILGLTATVQRALGAARREVDPAAYQLLSAAAQEVQGAMDDLRRLAHGIHPAILDLEGLAPALESLADHAQIRVAISVPDRTRLPQALEHAAYAVAAEAIREATRRDEDDLLVRVQHNGSWLDLHVNGTMQAPTSAVRDRVGAMGGQVANEGSSLEVRLPCE
jgi:signal transduction histidine kinase